MNEQLLKKIKALEARILLLETEVKELQSGGYSCVWCKDNKPEVLKWEPPVIMNGDICDSCGAEE